MCVLSMTQAVDAILCSEEPTILALEFDSLAANEFLFLVDQWWTQFVGPTPESSNHKKQPKTVLVSLTEFGALPQMLATSKTIFAMNNTRLLWLKWAMICFLNLSRILELATNDQLLVLAKFKPRFKNDLNQGSRIVITPNATGSKTILKIL